MVSLVEGQRGLLRAALTPPTRPIPTVRAGRQRTQRARGVWPRRRGSPTSLRTAAAEGWAVERNAGAPGLAREVLKGEKKAFVTPT